MNIRFLVKPGYIISQKDGDKHYISYSQLIGLYGVHPEMCILYKEGMERYYTPGYLETLVVLEPRNDGNYKKEEQK